MYIRHPSLTHHGVLMVPHPTFWAARHICLGFHESTSSTSSTPPESPHIRAAIELPARPPSPRPNEKARRREGEKAGYALPPRFFAKSINACQFAWASLAQLVRHSSESSSPSRWGGYCMLSCASWSRVESSQVESSRVPSFHGTQPALPSWKDGCFLPLSLLDHLFPEPATRPGSIGSIYPCWLEYVSRRHRRLRAAVIAPTSPSCFEQLLHLHRYSSASKQLLKSWRSLTRREHESPEPH